jgi:peptidoglycan biosynthesis protein MviN/MurJ (putative lipid II flippase)
MEIPPEPSSSTQVAKSAGSVGIAVFCSRILGLIREQVMAVLFGAGYYMDAFVVAFRIPNLLRDLFAEGALSAAFVTVFTDYGQTKGREATWRLANNVLVTLTLLLTLITLLGMFFSEEIIRITGTKSKIEYRPLPVDDPKVRQPDITRANTLLGWEPKVPLDEGLPRTLAYFRSKLGI